MANQFKKSKRILYLGIDPVRFQEDAEIVHRPIIRVEPFSLSQPDIKHAFEEMFLYTHLLFTSRVSVSFTVEFAKQANVSLLGKKMITVGSATAEKVRACGYSVSYTALKECGEGVIDLLKGLSLQESYLFFPHSNMAREIIHDYLQQNGLKYRALPIYQTLARPIFLEDLDSFDKIVFTSPSTVRAFVDQCGQLPPVEKCLAIGPITEKALCQNRK